MSKSHLLLIVLCTGLFAQNLYAREDLDARAVAISASPSDSGSGQVAELYNRSFDEPMFLEPPECDQASGWERWGSWGNRHTNQPNWRTRNGPGMIVYHHWDADSPNTGWSQVVTNLAGGSYYRFSVWAQWERNCNASNVTLRIEPLTDDMPYAVERFTSKDISECWTYITVQARLPPGVTEARFVIECIHGFGGVHGPAQGAIKFDDAKLENVSMRK